jgi:hypothetical protein
LRDAILEAALQLPIEGSSRAATEGTNEVVESEDEELDEEFVDDFEGIDWTRLPRFTKPLRTLKRTKSWVFQHGYRVALLRNPQRTYFVCKYCHQRKIPCTIPEVTRSTSNAINHLSQPLAGHRFDRKGQLTKPTLTHGQTTLRMIANAGVKVSQEVANEIGNFDDNIGFKSDVGYRLEYRI